MKSIRMGLHALLFAVCVGFPLASSLWGGESVATHGTGGRTKEMLQAMTPESVMNELKEGNARFVKNAPKAEDHLKQMEQTVHGQYPIAAVVGCMDSRVPTTIVFDQGIGDLFTIAVAGNVVNEDVLGSLEYACKVAGSKVVVVLGHTECGAVKGAIAQVKMGNLTDLLEKLEPAVEQAPQGITPRDAHNHDFINAVVRVNVRIMQGEVRKRSSILRDLENEGKIQIVGAVYDISTGKVTFL